MHRQVVLVNEEDQEMGTADIERAHQGKGLKHRALSLILYRIKQGERELLLQKRAAGKIVFKQLWANTMCTNMRPGDEYLARAVSRAKEEMGIKIGGRDLRRLYQFSYEAEDPTNPGWGENELDTVVVGEWSGTIKPNPKEVEEVKWVAWGELQNDITNNPDRYAPWLKLMVNDPRIRSELEI